MVVLGAVCLMAFVVIPGLWWSRELRTGSLGTTPAWKAQEKTRLARHSAVGRESTVGLLEPIMP